MPSFEFGRLFFKQLDLEMNAFGRKDSPLRMAARGFSTYDWDSVNFDNLAERYE